MISSVVLAAGHVGEQDSFAHVHNKPVLQWVLESALDSDLDEIICVTRDLANVRREIRVSNKRLCWMVNPAAERGQSSSVITGLWGSHPESAGVMFLAGDRMPVDKELINSLIRRFEQTGAWLVAPDSGGQAGSPVLFRRDLFPELLKLKGNETERTLLTRHAAQIVLVESREAFLLLGGSANQGRHP